MELKKITESVYYIPGIVNIGCITAGKKAILIDTGIDDSTGRKILNTLSSYGYEVKAIINTHSHADHCGGNSFIKSRTGALIYAPEIEEGIIKYPYIEPLYLFSGAEPLESLKNKFLMAKPSIVDYVISENDKNILIEGLNINILPLPGHSPNQIGVLYDGILFCADTFMSAELLKKHGIPFNIDIEKQKNTLQFLKNSSYKFYVPSHSNPEENVNYDIDENISVLNKIDTLIKEILCEAKTSDEVLKEVCIHYGISMNNMGQYCLLRTAVMAHLSSLTKREEINYSISENKLLWKRV